MNSVKKKVVLALGIFWLGAALAIAIPSYGTHAGPRHPNPSLFIIVIPIMVVGMTGVVKSAKSKALIALQIVCGLILMSIIFAMDQKSIGPNWPAYTCTLSAVAIGAISTAAILLMRIGEPTDETSSIVSETTDQSTNQD